jgi:hypothetical protein
MPQKIFPGGKPSSVTLDGSRPIIPFRLDFSLDPGYSMFYTLFNKEQVRYQRLIKTKEKENHTAGIDYFHSALKEMHKNYFDAGKVSRD